MDLESKVNTISKAFPLMLGLEISKTNVKSQKINDTTLETYTMVVSIFSMSDKDDWMRFFEKNFLFVNEKLNIVLVISFLTIDNANVNFTTTDL